MIVNKKTFTVKIDGVDTVLMVKRPDVDTANQSELLHGKAFREGIESGLMLRDKLMSVLRKQQLWDDEKEAEWQRANDTLLKGEMQLKKGGIKLSDAKQIALDMRVARYRLQALSADRNRLDSHTAEYYADNVKFNFLISQCVVNPDTGEKYYSSYDDYRNRQNDPVAQPASDALMAIMYGVEDNFEAKLVENKFLLKHKFVNEKLHLIDKQGNPVDRLGRRVDGQRGCRRGQHPAALAAERPPVAAADCQHRGDPGRAARAHRALDLGPGLRKHGAQRGLLAGRSDGG